MKYLFVGDIHNHQYILDDVNRLNDKYGFDRIIFLGDYVDDWNTDNHTSLETLNMVLNIKKMYENKVTLLLGNHEFSYLGYPCSGHHYELEDLMTMKLKENIDCFDLYTTVMCEDTEYYCSHAGFTNGYIINILSKDNWKDKLEEINNNIIANLSLYYFCSWFRGGMNEFSSPIWADKRELQANISGYIIPNQIVGHTPVTGIDIDSNLKFIDTHSTYRDEDNIGDKSYLIWNEDKFEVIY